MTAGHWWLAGTLAAVTVWSGQTAMAPGAQAEQAAPSPCRVSGTVAVSPKLVCPLEWADVVLVVRHACPAETGAGRVRWLRVTVQWPAGLRAEEPAAGGDELSAGLHHALSDPAAVVTLTQRVRPLIPGDYRLAEVQATVEDDAGGLATTVLDPATLVVPATCRHTVLYLPHLRQPSCVPLSQPADVALLLDRSSSVGPAGLVDATRAVRGFLDSTDLTRDRVALIAFDQRTAVLAPLGSSSAALDSALGNLTAAPGTRLERAIQAGVSELTGPRAQAGRRRILVLITDGVQVGPGGNEVVLQAAENARGLGLAILSLALGPRPDRDLLDAVSGDPHRTVPAATASDLAGAFRALADTAACTR